MNVKEIMSADIVCCTPDTPLQEVARLMVDKDCGEIPVVDGQRTMKPLGVITDRDITCRTVAQGRNPLQLKASDCMTSPALAVRLQDSLETCLAIMEDNQIRRVLVLDESGRCCGIVSQADVALHASRQETAEVVKEVSKKPHERGGGAPIVPTSKE